MKKIISFVLAALLLVSAVPMAHATNDYTVGTKVEYTAANNEAYTITVPAQLAPGGSGTVTLEGTWASDRVVSVTADKNVKLTNSINAADQKTLNVSFPGIDEYGSNTTSQTFTETVSVANIADALFGTWSGRFYYNVDVYDAVEYLQSKYAFDYYSTMNLAVTDVNNGTIGASADSDKSDAVAGIYTDENGGVNVVLLQDTTEATRIVSSVDMTINLGGHTLSTDNAACIDVIGGNLTIDGRLSGSTVQNNKTDGTTVSYGVQVKNDSVLTVKGGIYKTYSEGTSSLPICVLGTSSVTISDATICSTTVGGFAYGIQPIPGTTASISNCTITATNTAGNAYAVYHGADLTISECILSATTTDGISYGVACRGGNTTISNSDIRAYSNYDIDENYSSISIGIYNNQGTLTLNDCYVMGIHSGIQNTGTIYVNGGTYEGYGHGGFYFAASDTTSYVRDAIIRQCAMPDGYTAIVSSNNSGMYISGTDACNQTVYMDNCDIYGSSATQTIAIASTYGAQNNTLYISNSTINNLNGGIGHIRIDDTTHKLYIGTGNNFTADNTNRPTAVVVTDETYIYNG